MKKVLLLSLVPLLSTLFISMVLKEYLLQKQTESMSIKNNSEYPAILKYIKKVQARDAYQSALKRGGYYAYVNEV